MTYEVVIVGSGIMGAATAYYLSKKTNKVLLVDQLAIGNNLNASHDYSRVFRYDYGSDLYYTHLAIDSLKLWRTLERKGRKKLYFPSKALLLGDNWQRSYNRQSYRALKSLGLRVELLKDKLLWKRFPQFQAKYGVLDYHGGLLAASAAVKLFIDLARKNGITVREHTQAKHLDRKKITLADGETITFQKAVITCGVWVNKLLNNQLPITITRQEVVYFQPREKKLFNRFNCPVCLFEDGFYLVPIFGIEAVKLASISIGDSVDPDSYEKRLSKGLIVNCQRFFKLRIPALVDAKVVKTQVNLYDMTSDGDFIVDKLNDDIIVGAGFSGHGFKFAPLIGKIMAELVLMGKTSYNINRFSLKRFV